MATVPVRIKVGGRTDLPPINPGDTWDCEFNTGADGDQPSKVSVFTQGPNLGMTAVLTDESGKVINSVAEETATVSMQWNKSKPPTVGKMQSMHNKVTISSSLEPGSYGAQTDLTIGRG